MTSIETSPVDGRAEPAVDGSRPFGAHLRMSWWKPLVLLAALPLALLALQVALYHQVVPQPAHIGGQELQRRDRGRQRVIAALDDAHDEVVNGTLFATWKATGASTPPLMMAIRPAACSGVVRTTIASMAMVVPLTPKAVQPGASGATSATTPMPTPTSNAATVNTLMADGDAFPLDRSTDTGDASLLILAVVNVGMVALVWARERRARASSGSRR